MLALHNWLNPDAPALPKTPAEVEAKMRDLKVEVKSANGQFLFNYEDDAPRTDQIVAGCRGTVWKINAGTGRWICVRAAFDRFFNLGEDGAPPLPDDFTKITFQEKLDGTLVILYYDHDQAEWVWGTRNMFNLSLMKVTGGRSFSSVNKVPASEVVRHPLNKGCSYIFEACTPYNQVVVFHPSSKLVFLGVRETQYPFTELEPRGQLPNAIIDYPATYEFDNMEACRDYIKQHGGTMFEGMVLKFGNVAAPKRLKLKAEAFVSLAHTQKTNAPPEEQIVMAILKKDLPELLSLYPRWTATAGVMNGLVTELKKKIKATDDKLAALPSTATKADQATVIKTSACQTYHFARAKYASFDEYLLRLGDPLHVLKIIGWQLEETQ